MFMTDIMIDLGHDIAIELGDVVFDGLQEIRNGHAMHFTCQRTGGSFLARTVAEARKRLEEVRSTIEHRYISN